MTEETTQKHSLLYRILHGLTRFVLVLFAIILLLFGLLNLPVTQKFLTKKAASYLSSTLDTKVEIGYVGWRLPKQVFLEDVYIETPAGDSLFSLGGLEVGIGIFGLINNQIKIDRIGLYDFKGDIFVRQDTSNIAFITEAFMPADTAIVNNTPAADPNTPAAAPWEILLGDAIIDLQNIDVLYDDMPAGMKLDLNVKKIAGTIGTADLVTNKYILDNLTLANADIFYLAYPTPVDTTAKVPLNYTLGASEISLENVQYAMLMDDIDLDMKIGEGYTEDLNVLLTEAGVAVKTNTLKLTETDFKYDLVGTPEIKGFDANHLDFRDLGLDAESLEYEGTDIEMEINNMQAKLGDDLELKKAKGTIIFNNKGVDLQNFVMQTGGSDFGESDIRILFNFLDTTANLENMGLDITIPEGSLDPKDLLYFSPDLEPFFVNAKENLVVKDTRITGSLKQMQIENVDFTGFGSTLKASGQIENAMNTNLLSMNLNVEKLESRGAVLKEFLPENTLPEGTELPEKMNLKGSLNGSLAQKLNIDIQARTSRTNSDSSTEIDLAGSLSSLLTDSLSYDLNISKFTSDDTELNAYMPDGILPAGYTLPTAIDLTGRVAGTMNSVQPDLVLKAKTPTGNALIETKGAINNFTNPNFDFSLVQTEIDTNFLLYILPDSLLPAEVRLPNIESGKMDLKGPLASLNADVDVKTTAGNLVANVKSDNEIYNFSAELKELNLLKVTSGSLYDTIARTNLNAINLQITGQAKNIDSLEIATGNAKMQIQEIGSEFPGLQADMVLKPSGVSADLQFQDIAGAADFDVFYDMKNKYKATGSFSEFDFKDIPYVRYPIIMDGNLDVSARYDSLSNMTADVLLEEFNFDYNDENYPLNRMKADVDFLGENKDVLLRSDWVDADVKGNFAFEDLSIEIQNIVNDYIEQGEDVKIESDSNAKLKATAQWKNTAILTSGIVPGLEVIEPFDLKLDFVAEQEKLSANLNFPKIVYAGNEINMLTGNAATGANNLGYSFDIKSLQLAGAKNMGEVKLTGGVNDGLFRANLVNIDTTQATNLDLTALVSAADGRYTLRLEEDITLNNEPWKFSPQNEIIYTPENITVNDWRLSNGKQSLSLESVSSEQVQATFKGFRIEELLSVVQMQDVGGGAINGTVTVDNPLGDLRVDADLDIKNAVFYQNPLGDARIDVNNKKKVDAYAVDFVLKGEGNDAQIKGVYDLGNPVDALNFVVDIKSLKLAPFQPLAEGVVSNMHGYLVTDAEISGTATAPSLIGFVQMKDAGLTIDQLGAPFNFGEQKIDLDGNVIRFRDFEVLDSTNNKALVNAYIITEDFVSYEYDLDVSAKNFLVLNTTEEDNELYYGKMYVDAVAEVKGDLFSPVIEVTASPRKNSDLTYIVPASSTSVDYGEGVVTFVDGLDDVEEQEINPSDTVRSQVAQALNLTMRVNLEMNDNLNFTAVIDPVTNSAFSGKGEGFLTFSMYPSGEMEMSGTFTMKDGTYNFIYAELVKRTFDVVSGSTITWTGDIYNPALDVKVQYKIKASPLPLVGGQATLSASQEAALSVNQTFIVQLNITGSLEKTDIATTLLYPDVSGNTKNAEVTSAIDLLQQNPNRMNEQAFGLILFNGFVSENLNIGASVLNAQGGINDAISGQLNNLANRYIKFVELDFGLDNYENYDSENGGTYNQTNVNLTVRKRFFQDRLVVSIDGETSSDTRSGAAETQVFLDNLTVEYSLTKNGNWRVKVYNERDEDDVLARDVIRTGAALVISKDFNELRFFGKDKEEKKEVVIVVVIFSTLFDGKVYLFKIQ